MKKSILIALAALACACAGQNKVIFADDFNSQEQYEAAWQLPERAQGQVEWLAEGGVDNSACIQISGEETTYAVKHTIAGLEAGKLYRASAMIKLEDVKGGRGAVMFIKYDDKTQGWNASKFLYDTQDWQEVYIDFIASSTGDATLCLSLGFPWGTYLGNKTTGKVWYDNVRVEPTPMEEIYYREGEHIILSLYKEKVNITDEQVDTWLKNLDKVYEAYLDLVGEAPYGGAKIMILNTPGIEPGYWALAGNPILWNSNVKVEEVINRTAEFDDWGFGVMHEIGHDFSHANIKGDGAWNWNDEIFANFRMSYALEACDGTASQRNICYKGADIINYYKIFYDETIGAGIAKNNGDALHYTFLRIKEKYGWDVYKKAFRTLYATTNAELPKFEGNYDKFLYFLSHVSAAAGEDVTKTCYTEQELKLIEESLQTHHRTSTSKR